MLKYCTVYSLHKIQEIFTKDTQVQYNRHEKKKPTLPIFCLANVTGKIGVLSKRTEVRILHFPLFYFFLCPSLLDGGSNPALSSFFLLCVHGTVQVCAFVVCLSYHRHNLKSYGITTPKSMLLWQIELSSTTK